MFRALADSEFLAESDPATYTRIGMRMLEALEGCRDITCVFHCHRLHFKLHLIDYQLAEEVWQHLRMLAQRYFGNPDIAMNYELLKKFGHLPRVIVFGPEG